MRVPAVWMALAAKDVSGKIPAIFFPAAIWPGVPGVGWGNTLLNWLLAGVGNLVGAVVFVSTSYWYQFLRGRPEKAEISTAEAAERT
jgi:formate/nitrite transporter FocA (FNT family)